MPIELRSYREYMDYYLSHPSQRQHESTKEENRWERVRRVLIKSLSSFGKVGNSGDENIDIFVGSDWFGDKCFHVVLMGWQLLDPDLVSAIARVLTKNPEYTATIAKAPPEPGCSLEIFVTKDQALARVFKKKARDGLRVIGRHPVLCKFLRALSSDCL
jgi:hypothetical protein